MKLKFFAMAAVLCAFTIACNKENTSSDPESEPEAPDVVYSPCEHNNIEFVAAVERTDTTPGNIAHYHCLECNRYFLDAEATTEIRNAYLPAKNRTIDPAILDRIKHIYPFIFTSEQAEDETKGMQTKSGKIPSPVSSLYKSVKKHKYKTDAKEVVDECLTSLKEIQAAVDSINDKVDIIQEQTAQILSLLKEASCKEEVYTLVNRARSIYNLSIKYLPRIEEEYNNYLHDVTTEEEFQSKIKGISQQWATESDAYVEKGNLYGLTVSLINEFSNYLDLARGKATTYPRLFKEYVSCYRLWDHDGYTDRKQLDIAIEVSLSVGYFMACLYRDNGKHYFDPGIRQTDSTDLLTSFKLIEPLVEDDFDGMEKAWNAYRRFYDGYNTLFINNAAWAPIPDVIADRLDTYNITIYYKDQANIAAGISEMMRCWDDYYSSNIQSGNYLTVDNYSTIRNAYSNGDIYSILANNAQVIDMPSWYGERKEGGIRNQFIPYNDVTQWKYDDHFFTGTLEWAKVWYNQYYEYFDYADGQQLFYMDVYGMSGSCTRSDNYEKLLYGYMYSSYSWNIYRAHPQYWGATNAPVYIGIYTGDKYDEDEYKSKHPVNVL